MSEPARASKRPRPKFWRSNGTWIWFPECQHLVAAHFRRQPLEWIADEVLRTARAINEERGKAHLGPATVGAGAVLFCACKLELITQAEYDTITKRATRQRGRAARSARLKEADGTTYFAPALRAEVLARDGDTCQYCSAPADAIDHLVPVAAGGTTSPANLIAACRTCNSIKGSKQFPKALEAFVAGALRVGRTVDRGWPPIWQQAHAKHPWAQRPISLTDVFDKREP